jgi:flagella basal body P-ring formation protein FlgA
MFHDGRGISGENGSLSSFAQNHRQVGYMRANFPIFLLLAVAASFPARGLADAEWLDPQRLRAQAAAWLEQKAAASYPGSVVEVTVGEIDPRLKLTVCADPLFFLPAHAQLWGQGSLGLRCETPTPWSFYLSYLSRVSGPALVATRPIASREMPGAADVQLRQIEYTQSPQLYPRVLPPNARVNRPVPAGQPIVVSWLILPAVVQAGHKVRLQTTTAAFTVSQEGTALNTATPGESVKVKTSNGRVVYGTANSDGSVEVRP